MFVFLPWVFAESMFLLCLLPIRCIVVLFIAYSLYCLLLDCRASDCLHSLDKPLEHCLHSGTYIAIQHTTFNLVNIEIASRNPARPRELSHAVFLPTTLENYRSRQELSIGCRMTQDGGLHVPVMATSTSMFPVVLQFAIVLSNKQPKEKTCGNTNKESTCGNESDKETTCGN